MGICRGGKTPYFCFEENPNSQKPTIFYGWWIVGACLMSMSISGGTCFFAFPVFLKPLTEEFGWSRAEVSGGISIFLISVAVAAPFVGGLTSKYGSRKVMIPSALTAGLCFILLSWLTSMWQFYSLRFLMGFAFTALAHVPVNVTLSRWFVKKRGRAVGIALIGMPLGGLIFTPLAASLVERLGWQTTFVALGLLIWVVLLPALILVMRNDPRDLSLSPDGAGDEVKPSAGSTGAAGPGLSVGEALGTGSFWTLVVLFFVLYGSIISILIHQFPYITDLGYTPEGAAMVVSAVLTFSVIGGLSFGGASDRFNVLHLAALCFTLGAAGVALLMQAVSIWLLYGYITLFGLAYGGVDPLMAVVVGRTFGVKAYGVIYGLYQAVISVSGLIGPIALGYIYDTTLSYHWGFVMVVGGLMFSAGLILCARSATAVTVVPATERV